MLLADNHTKAPISLGAFFFDEAGTSLVPLFPGLT